MPDVLTDKRKCCGCSACSHVCPKECIAMLEDNEGFLYPEIDSNKCIECDKCRKVCPVLNADSGKERNIRDKVYPVAYGGWNLDNDTRSESSSGGAFSIMAEKILEQGGKVYGCALDNNMNAVHIGVNTKKELYRLRGSKYVQSEIGNVYREIKSILESGRKVLFVGTPCQAAGLNSYLGKHYENLYKVDFICHGVPSPKVFKSYINHLEKERGAQITTFKFRNKDHGWHSSGMQLGTLIKFDNHKDIRKYPAFRDTYMNGFLKDIYLRPSCYNCAFKKLPKDYVDFTIADFWGVNRVSKNLNDGKGTSLILVHNDHGAAFWDQIKAGFYYQQVNLESALKHNRSIVCSVAENSGRERFFIEFKEKGYDYVERKYLSAYSWVKRKSLKVLKGLLVGQKR